MNSREYLTNRAFCPVPWTGLMYNFDGTIKNCIRSSAPIGNINDNTIEQILSNDLMIKADMRTEQKFDRCNPCYELEQEQNKFDIISDRVFYLKELREVDNTLYDTTNHALHTVDIRWSNLCNFACVYCSPEFSSKWASERSVTMLTPTNSQVDKFKQYVFKRAPQLKHVYLAGGEPLLMKENLEFLQLLKQVNPKVNLRINTNLSKVDTRIFDLICEFKNVHWIVSAETIEAEYEYIRHGGSWQDFVDNLQIIRQLDHKISFNMLHFLLNYKSIFDCVDYLSALGFHNNSFIIGALTGPAYLNIRHLSDNVLNSVKKILADRIAEQPGYLLENGYQNMLKHLDQPFEKDLSGSFEKIANMDQRRKLDSRAIFKDLYKEENHGKTI
jgi:sulfatase maturation enzyme AslB (radical SAM superfamily)